MGKERDADKKHGVVERAATADEMGEPETLEIQPLAIMEAGKHHSVSPDWVLERVLAFCQELGSHVMGMRRNCWHYLPQLRPIDLSGKGKWSSEV